jgi:hypothetical protein
MSVERPKKRRPLVTTYAISIIVFCLIIILSFFLAIRAGKHVGSEAVDNLSHLKKPGWNGYIKLTNGFLKLHQNWADSGIKKQVEVLGQNEFVQSEFDRQISEIKRISNAEESVKWTELNQSFQDYTKKHRQALDEELLKQSATINNALNRGLRQKITETDQQIRKYRNDLELEQRLKLVNLQLQLSVSDLNASQNDLKEQQNKIQLEIASIKEKITQMVAAKREFLNNQLLSYQKQRSDQARVELDDLKAKLEIDMENDLAAYRAILDSDFKAWCQQQADQFDLAIKIRREQKKK